MIAYLLRTKMKDRVFTDGKKLYVACIINNRPALREPTEEEAEEITQKIYDEGRENK